MAELLVKLLREGAQAPSYATDGAAGLDLAALPDGEITLAPGARCAVPTGIALELPPGHEGQVRPRSGLARRHGVTVVNAPGTIDEDFRGEVHVLLVNLGSEDFVIRPGDRVAQLVVAPVSRVAVSIRSELSETRRAEGGFGSTGVRGRSRA